MWCTRRVLREGARADQAQGGDPRPPGRGGRARASGAWLRWRGQRARGAHGGARGRGRAPDRADVREAARQPAGRGLRDPADRLRRDGVKFGVLQFPGSCDELDALRAASLVGEAELLWHGERDLRGADAIIVPGGFSYGDYLRAGAIARFSPAMESVIDFADEGGLVLGICNGFQVLCEARLLPGALLGNANRRFTCRQLALEVVNADTPFTRACERGATLSIPAKHSVGRFYADDETLQELAMYSLMWSEHCAYKHSRKLLRGLPTKGPHVVMGPGENAGAVDVGGGLVCAFKVESHNHPSAVEPFQGAATGVGGILRDIFAIGARPIAVLDSLRFGELGDRPAEARARYLLDGAVSGIGHYGNSIGVPTVGGDVHFEAPYEHNCLVNAMALGLAPREQLVRSAAAGTGNVLVLFGASTGRDGIGGASVLASAEL